jgi:phosphoserine/homoserine phosphotransferase
LRKNFQFLIISDSFYEFLSPLLRKLDYPLVFCNSFVVDKEGFIVGYKRIRKERIIKFLKEIGIGTIAIGDSYNDLKMLKSADFGILFKPSFKDQSKKIKIAKNYTQLKKIIKKTTQLF